MLHLLSFKQTVVNLKKHNQEEQFEYFRIKCKYLLWMGIMVSSDEYIHLGYLGSALAELHLEPRGLVQIRRKYHKAENPFRRIALVKTLSAIEA